MRVINGRCMHRNFKIAPDTSSPRLTSFGHCVQAKDNAKSQSSETSWWCAQARNVRLVHTHCIPSNMHRFGVMWQSKTSVAWTMLLYIDRCCLIDEHDWSQTTNMKITQLRLKTLADVACRLQMSLLRCAHSMSVHERLGWCHIC